LDQLTNGDAIALYERFVRARESAIISEIRRVCGITEITDVGPQDREPDEIAPDLQIESASSEEELEVAFDRT
jgi:hypothetical protein